MPRMRGDPVRRGQPSQYDGAATAVTADGTLMGRSLFVQPQNHGRVWVGRDFTDHCVPAPLPWAGTPSTIPGCSEPRPGMGRDPFRQPRVVRAGPRPVGVAAAGSARGPGPTQRPPGTAQPRGGIN